MQVSAQENQDHIEGSSTATALSGYPALSMAVKSVPTSMGATRSKQDSRRDHFGHVKSERAQHSRTQVRELLMVHEIALNIHVHGLVNRLHSSETFYCQYVTF